MEEAAWLYMKHLLSCLFIFSLFDCILALPLAVFFLNGPKGGVVLDFSRGDVVLA